MNIEILYSLVTEAIRRAEVLEELGAPGAHTAYLDVSLLEERIARLLPASDVEGAIARRGAVRAAVTARQFQRADELIIRFSAEPDLDAALKADLLALQEQSAAQILSDDQAISLQFPSVIRPCSAERQGST